MSQYTVPSYVSESAGVVGREVDLPMLLRETLFTVGGSLMMLELSSTTSFSHLPAYRKREPREKKDPPVTTTPCLFEFSSLWAKVNYKYSPHLRICKYYSILQLVIHLLDPDFGYLIC